MKEFAYACAFIAFTLTGFAGCRSSTVSKPLDSLREIKIGRRTLFGRQTILVLGGKIPEASEFCDWSGATCSLNPGTFGGTESMSLRKTESGLISQFHFDYGVMSSDAVNAQIDDYIRRLGKPSSDSTAIDGGFDAHRLAWQDSATTFELTYKTDRNEIEASASLFDNSLARPAH
jgi:hypothetical protein